MAGALITDRELALWSQTTEDVIAADDWAQELIAKFSDYARHLSKVDWSLAPVGADEVVPSVDVRMAILAATRRTYVNPDSEKSTGIGPISSTILDSAALAGAFTESERALLESYNPDGDPAGLWVQPTTRGDFVLPVEEVLYVPDDSQVALTEADSAWPSWDIPLFNPGDPGGDG